MKRLSSVTRCICKVKAGIISRSFVFRAEYGTNQLGCKFRFLPSLNEIDEFINKAEWLCDGRNCKQLEINTGRRSEFAHLKLIAVPPAEAEQWKRRLRPWRRSREFDLQQAQSQLANSKLEVNCWEKDGAATRSAGEGTCVPRVVAFRES